jgi:Smg protein
MVDILIFVYENFFASGIYPGHAVLQNRLFAAGFSEAEVEAALTWLDHVDQLGQHIDSPALQGCGGIRCLDPSESEKLGHDGWGFLVFLENNQILTPLQREWIMASIMALDHSEVDLDRLKLVVLMVLWRQGHPLEAMLVEELIHYQDRILQ